MSWFIRLFSRPEVVHTPKIAHRQPQLPPGFVRRSDPNFYFLARKF
jgi:hypothetical protein